MSEQDSKKNAQKAQPLNNKMKNRKPPTENIESFQLDVFSQFLTNDDGSGVSNAIEVWESFPKYHFSKQQQIKLRGKDGLATPFDWVYEHDGVEYKTRIQPASIEEAGGTFRSFFPGEVEELVEEALKKILTLQNHGVHVSSERETWVKFSLRHLTRELKSMGHSIKLSRLKMAIQIMSQSVISIYRVGDKGPLYSGALLSDLFIVNREDYLEDSTAMCTARLPVFISRSIDTQRYRQFNYVCYMNLNMQLSRWIYKKLVNRFTHASMLTTYHFSLNKIANQSGHLQLKSITDRRIQCIKALDDLKANNVLIDWAITKQHMDGRTIADIVFDLRPHPDFIGDQKAANKRLKSSKSLIEN